jgi:hypothetical protein
MVMCERDIYAILGFCNPLLCVISTEFMELKNKVDVIEVGICITINVG